ncbi:MAG: AzlD domain-containing protein [Bellilinea sp.]|jgi:branched-subunit amino acid transport protein
MNLWAAMLIGGGLTYLTRLSFIFVFGIFDAPPLLKRALRFVPSAVLSAIVFQELFIREGAVNLTLENHRLLAGILAIVIGIRTRKSLLVIGIGMAVLWILNLVLPG